MLSEIVNIITLVIGKTLKQTVTLCIKHEKRNNISGLMSTAVKQN